MSEQYRTDVQKSNFDGKWDAASVMVTVSGAVALYSSLEMVLLIMTTFKKWRGLYFWSMSLCNLGVLSYTLGFMMVYFQMATLWLSKAFNDIGWIGLVVCQSLILYSRLGLVVFNPNILKAVKWMIIVDSVILVPFPIVFDYGTSFSGKPVWPRGYFYVEHIQITIFCVQECIISGLYIWKTISLLKVIKKENAREVVWQLMIINAIIIPTDTALIVLQFLKFQLYQEGIKTFAYAVKVKLELHILSKLVDFISENKKSRRMGIDAIDSDSIAGQGQVDLQQEVWSGKDITSSATSDDRDMPNVRHVEDKKTSSYWQPSTSANPSAGKTESNTITHSYRDVDGAMELSLQYTRTSQRLHGRESDALYAETLKSLG